MTARRGVGAEVENCNKQLADDGCGPRLGRGARIAGGRVLLPESDIPFVTDRAA